MIFVSNSANLVSKISRGQISKLRIWIAQKISATIKTTIFRGGIEHFNPCLAMELLLLCASHKYTNLTAHRLLNQFGSIANVMDAPIELLKQCPEVRDYTATLLKLIPELARIYIG